MSAHPGFPAVLMRTVEALEAHLSKTAPVEVARTVGVSHTTVPRRGSDLSAWPARDLIALAAHHAPLREALCSWHRVEETGNGMRAETACRQAVACMGTEIGTIMTRLDDGVITREEAEATERELASIEERIGALRADLRARARGVRL